MAGIEEADGDAVVLIDADLQDPPSLITEFYKKWCEGNEVVYGKRKKRHGESVFKRLTARIFYRLLNKLSEVEIPLDTGDFRLMDRKVVDQLLSMPERSRFLRGMVAWVGFRQCAVEYERDERYAGVSKYPLSKMMKFAADGILSFSAIPLKLATFAGLATFGLSVVGFVYAVCLRLLTDNWVNGWTALFVAVLFFGGLQLLTLGLIGEYVARIYTESKGRPHYIIDEVCVAADDDDEPENQV
jgi:dolichol-phosphate mannosyltransferase